MIEYRISNNEYRISKCPDGERKMKYRISNIEVSGWREKYYITSNEYRSVRREREKEETKNNKVPNR